MGFNKFEFKKFEPIRFDPNSKSALKSNITSTITTITKLIESKEFNQMVDLDTILAMEDVRQELIKVRKNM